MTVGHVPAKGAAKMGEIANAAIEGSTCSWCGVFFNGAHGFPVLCQSCAKDTSPAEMRELGLQRATRSEL